MLVQERAYKSPDIVRFLKHLLRHIPGKLLVLWDGAPIHRGQPVKDFLAAGGAERLRLESFPGYAPDLNPDEGIWRYLKHVELRNLCCATLAQLRRHLRLATARLRHKRQGDCITLSSAQTVEDRAEIGVVKGGAQALGGDAGAP